MVAGVGLSGTVIAVMKDVSRKTEGGGEGASFDG